MRKALGSRLVDVEERDEPPHAADLVALAGPAFKRGEGVDAGDAVPVYVRDRVTRSKCGAVLGCKLTVSCRRSRWVVVVPTVKVSSLR